MLKEVLISRFFLMVRILRYNACEGNPSKLWIRVWYLLNKGGYSLDHHFPYLVRLVVSTNIWSDQLRS
ncbi:hypothetical protein XELAEV_18039032mg [Xenopus laevis]|uniref:Uncharacterized protein n=1 Tax=Xenopus laevis TaxID=8355 RepID=A0A974H7F5_XENLA|nr:hypothetical protein XELAEV_18039032mg [Xenopus laevis]